MAGVVASEDGSNVLESGILPVAFALGVSGPLGIDLGREGVRIREILGWEKVRGVPWRGEKE